MHLHSEIQQQSREFSSPGKKHIQHLCPVFFSTKVVWCLHNWTIIKWGNHLESTLRGFLPPSNPLEKFRRNPQFSIGICNNILRANPWEQRAHLPWKTWARPGEESIFTMRETHDKSMYKKHFISHSGHSQHSSPCYHGSVLVPSIRCKHVAVPRTRKWLSKSKSPSPKRRLCNVTSFNS